MDEKERARALSATLGQIEKQFGKEITTRTWKTVHRILEKLNDG